MGCEKAGSSLPPKVSSDRKLSSISSRVAGAEVVFFVAGSTITVRGGGICERLISPPAIGDVEARSVASFTLPKATHSALFAAMLECLKPPLKKTSEIYMTVQLWLVISLAIGVFFVGPLLPQPAEKPLLAG